MKEEKIVKIFMLFIMCCYLIFAAGELFGSDGFVLNIWMDRDVWRSTTYDIWDTITGPESNTGSRAPGGFFYALLHMSLLAHWAPQTPNVLRVILNLASIAILFAFSKKEFGLYPSFFITGVYVSSGMLKTVAVYWNPGFMPVFAVLMTTCIYNYVKYRRVLEFFIFFIALSISSQIHQQSILLFVSFILILFLWKTRPPWIHICAALVGFIAPYGMYLFAEIQTGFINFRTMLQNLMHSGYVITGGDNFVDSTVNFVVGVTQITCVLFGHSVDPVRGLFGGLFGDVLATGLEARDILLGVIVFCFVGYLCLRALKIVKTLESNTEDWITGIFVTILGVALLKTGTGYTVPRHLVVVMPSVAILTGLAVYTFSTYLERARHAKLGSLFGTICLIGLSGQVLLYGALGFTSVAVTANRHRGMQEMANYFTRTYGWSYEDVEARVTSFSYENGAFTPKRVTFGSYFMFQPPRKDIVAFNDMCVLVLSKYEWKGTLGENAVRKLMSHDLLAALSPQVIGRSQSENFHYINYRGLDGNCLKGATNPYIESEEEISGYMKPRHLAEPMLSEVRSIISRDRTFPSVGFTFWDDQSRYPLTVLFGLEEGQVVARLDGRELHGYTGIHTREIEVPEIIVKNPATGQKFIFSTHIKKIQGEQKIGYLTPWRFGAVALPAGTYQASFHWREKMDDQSIVLGTLTLTDNAELSTTTERPTLHEK